MHTLGTPPKYMVVTRELKFTFLHTLTHPQCRTGYNFVCNLFSKIWILTLLAWNCPTTIMSHKFFHAHSINIWRKSAGCWLTHLHWLKISWSTLDRDVKYWSSVNQDANGGSITCRVSTKGTCTNGLSTANDPALI